MQPPPGHKEIQEFRFNRLCNLRIFPSNQKLSRKDALSVVATSNKHGLIFAGTPTGLQCIPVSSVFEQQSKRSNNRGTIGNYSRRELNFGQSPSHVAVNNTGDLVGVVILSQACPVLLVYVVQTFAVQDVVKLSEIRLSGSPGARVLDLQWNPAIPNTVGVVLSDGSAMVVEIKSGGAPTISASPATTMATCLCWSPKGKQVAIGSSTGSLAQYKPDLTLVKSYNPPQIENAQLEVVSLHWISSFQFIAVYKLKNAPQARSFVVVVNVPKNGPQTFVNYEDICFGTESLRHEHYFIHLAAWNLIIISTGNALEASVLHQEGESWVQWLLDDGGRAELPQTENHEDVFTVGMALNLNATDPIPIGDHMTSPPMPLLLMMSEEGVLSLFHTMNLLPDCPQVCTPARDLPKLLFSVPEAGEPATQIQSQPQQMQNQQQMQSQQQQMQSPQQQMQSPQQQTQNQQPLFQNQSKSQHGTPTSSTVSAPKPSLTGGPTQQTLPPFSAPASSPFQMSPGFGSLGQTSQSPFQLNTTLNLGKAPNFGQFTSTPPVSDSTPQKSTGQAYLPQQKQEIQKPPAFQPTPTSGAPGLFGAPSAKPADPQAPTLGFGIGSSGVSPSTMPQPTPKQQVAPSPLAGLPAQTTPAEQPPPTPKAEIQASPPPSGPPPIDESVIINEVFREFDSMKSFMGKRSVDRTNYNKLRSNKTLFPSLSINLNELEEFEKELRDTTSAESAEVKGLRNRLLELWGWVEIAKARDRQANSSRYLDAFESKELDSTLKELMKDIDQNSLFIETKIKQLENHLLQLWQKYKEPGSIKSFDIPNMEAIYQTLTLNCRILALQQSRIKEQKKHLSEVLRERSKKIPRSISDSSDKWKSYQWSANNDSKSNPLEKLANKLLSTKIEGPDEAPRSFKETSKQYIALSNSRVRKLSASKEAALWEWHKSHKLITTKVSRMPVPDNEVLNSSRISAASTPVKASDEQSQQPAGKAVAKNLFPHAKPSSIITSTPLSSIRKKGEKPAESVNPADVPGNVQNLTAKSISNTFSSSFGSSTAAPFASNQSGLSSLQPKTPVVTPKTTQPTKANEPTGQAKITPEATGKSPTTSSSALFSLLSGSTVTAAATDKDKSMFGSTPPSSIFGNTPLFGETPVSKAPPNTVAAGKSPATITGGQDDKAFGGFLQATTTASTPPSSTASQTAFSSMSFAQPKASTASIFGGSASSSSGGSLFNFASPATTASGLAFGSISAASPAEGAKPALVTSVFSSPQPVATQVSGVASSPSAASSTIAPARSSAAQAKPAPTITSSFSFGNPASTSLSAPTTAGLTFSFASPASSAPSLSVASSISSSTAQTTIATPSTTQSVTPPSEAVTSSSAVSDLSPPSTSAPAQVLQTPPKSESAFGATAPQSVFATPTTAGQQTGSIPSTPVTSTLSTPQGQMFKSPTPGAAQTTSAAQITLAAQATPAAQTTPAAQPITSPSNQPMFGTAPSSTQSVFGTTTASAQPIFGTPTSSVSFGTAVSSGGSVFSSAPNAPTSSVFGISATPSQPIFGTPATSAQPTFGTPTATTNQPMFGTPATSAQPAFSTTPQQPAFGSINFGSATSKLPFGAPTTQQAPLFGSPTVTSAQQTFGTPATATPPAFGSTPTSSVFGSPAPAATSSSSSVFGASNLLSNTSFFGSPATTASTGFGTTPAANIFGGSTGFSSSQTSTTTANIFGQAVCSPNVATTPTNAANPFGSPFGQKSTFGATPALGTMSSPGAFGSSGGSLFGGSTFGQPSQQANIFQSNNASPSVFGTPTQSPGAFSSGNQSAQSGFGGASFARSSPTQPVFGGQATFGSSPTFGGNPGFGSSPAKPFGAAPAPTSFGTQSSTFENLANQNTVSFGNLAQSTPPSFGASSPGGFGQPQQQQQQQPQQQQQQQPFSNAPVFGGSSFSSWR